MDEKRTAIAVLVSICAILLYSELVMDPYVKSGVDARAAQARIAAKQATAAAVSAATIGGQSTGSQSVNSTTSGASNDPRLNAAVSSDPTSQPLSAAILAAGEVTIENDYVVARVSLLGGRLTSYTLKRFQSHFGTTDLVELVAGLDGAPLPLGLFIGDRADASVLYTATKTQDGRGVTLSGSYPSSPIQIKKSIVLAPTGYLSGISADVTGSDAPISFEWSRFVSVTDGDAALNPVSFKVLGSDNKLTNTLAGELPTQILPVSSPMWIGFGDRYFLSTLIPLNGAQGNSPLTGATVSQKRSDGSHLFSIRLGGVPNQLDLKLYGGPKIAEVLAEAQPGLERTIDLGWFSFLAFPLLAGLKILHAGLQNWGLAIVALTLVLKSLFLPLTKASFKSMKAMQGLQPEMKAMREKIKDPAVLNQEMLKLYQKHKVNPMGGCFPMLLQIPVFIGLYNVLLNAIELRHAPFALWIQDLSSPEVLLVAGIPVPLMVLILGVSMFLQQYYTPTVGLDPVQRKVMLFMPVILTGSFLIYPLPAGLVLYWVVNNTISIVQQVFLNTDRKMTPYQATAIAGVIMFIFAFALTRV